jgi:hypothetical protein
MSRRAVHIASGIGVLFTSLIFVHLVHHALIVHRQEFSPASLIAVLIIAAAVGIFSFIGAFLLLTGERNPKSD